MLYFPEQIQTQAFPLENPFISPFRGQEHWLIWQKRLAPPSQMDEVLSWSAYRPTQLQRAAFNHELASPFPLICPLPSSLFVAPFPTKLYSCVNGPYIQM